MQDFNLTTWEGYGTMWEINLSLVLSLLLMISVILFTRNSISDFKREKSLKKHQLESENLIKNPQCEGISDVYLCTFGAQRRVLVNSF